MIRRPKPEKKFQAGGCEASIFENEINQHGKSFKINKVAFQKRYKGSNGWETTHSLDANDLPKAILVLSKAYEYLALSPESPEKIDFGSEERKG